MRPRTPTFVWIPFVFSVGTISWALLVVGLAALSAVVIAPAIRDVKDQEQVRNDYKATLQFTNQRIDMQKEFIHDATTDPLLMERIAARQLNILRKDQKILPLDPEAPYKDHSTDTLLAESLKPVEAAKVPPMHPILALALEPTLRPMLIITGCLAMALSFFLGVKYQRA